MLKKFCTLILVGGLSLVYCVSALATGDAAAGQAKAALCAACHGQDGNSVSPEFPKIAGQVPGYIAAQLAAYKSGKRPSQIMAGLVVSLTEQDMADIDAYYSQFEQTQASIAETDIAAAERGRELYRIGASKYSIPACMACHGPAGNGIPSRYPKVSGQYKEYLMQSLHEFKDASRVSDEMNPIAFRLSAQQIEDLAIYMQGLN